MLHLFRCSSFSVTPVTTVFFPVTFRFFRSQEVFFRTHHLFLVTRLVFPGTYVFFVFGRPGANANFNREFTNTSVSVCYVFELFFGSPKHALSVVLYTCALFFSIQCKPLLYYRVRAQHPATVGPARSPGWRGGKRAEPSQRVHLGGRLQRKLPKRKQRKPMLRAMLRHQTKGDS